jgi:2-polyprenyl-6-hydroxyphenyl methylase/3-demethylubiquinone-9 3-methyltransferase
MRNDLGLYERHAASWWDPASRFAASLHGLNHLRLGHIRDRFGADLGGLDVVDLGCGGGLMAEPLARLGATVVGIDLSPASLAAARAHGAGVPGLRYELGDLRRPPLPPASADLVCCADVLEHVDGWREAVGAAARLLRPGGWLYASTINRTLRARMLAVHVAEGLRLIPPGTHDPARFIRPDELIAAAAAAGLRHQQVLGERLRIVATLRAWAVRLAPGASTAIGYAAWFQR